MREELRREEEGRREQSRRGRGEEQSRAEERQNDSPTALLLTCAPPLSAGTPGTPRA